MGFTTLFRAETVCLCAILTHKQTPQSTRGNTRRTTLLSTHDEGVQQTPQQQQQQQQQDPHTPVRSVTHRPRSLSSLSSIFADGNGHAINADAAMSTVSRPLLLTESLRLVGGVLWLLRATFILLGRRPFGRGSADDNLSQTLFRRLCSLLEFLENVRNERIKFEKYSSGSGTHGSGGAGLGGGTGGALFRPSRYVRETEKYLCLQIMRSLTPACV